MDVDAIFREVESLREQVRALEGQRDRWQAVAQCHAGDLSDLRNRWLHYESRVAEQESELTTLRARAEAAERERDQALRDWRFLAEGRDA